MRVAPAAIASLYQAACLAELDALKPGNVHAYAAGHRMAVSDFVASAAASAPALAHIGAGVGTRVRDAVAATFAVVGKNTNLGILLLCAPPALAAERGITVADVLAGLEPADSQGVFEAIRLANPGGLGRAGRHDVAAPAPDSLLSAMADAAPRDRIARAYVDGFADLFTIGLPALAAARARGLDPAWCTAAIYLAYLQAFPDSHVARKHGADRAEAVRAQAVAALANLDLHAGPVEPLLALDSAWKAAGINPGTSADFTVATLFCDALASAGARLADAARVP